MCIRDRCTQPSPHDRARPVPSRRSDRASSTAPVRWPDLGRGPPGGGSRAALHDLRTADPRRAPPGRAPAGRIQRPWPGGQRVVNGRPGMAEEPSPALAVFRNRPFLILWLSQVATQVGGNMVLYGLSVLVFTASGSSSAVAILLISFLAPAVVFGALAGVYVCLLYTSDAADDLLCVDLGGRRIIKKKK